MNESQRSMELQKQFKGEELQKKCCEWTMEILDDFKFQDLPIKPSDVEEYESRPEDSVLSEAYFRAHPQIFVYYDLVSYIRTKNRGIYEWLSYCKNYVGQEDQKRIEDRLGECTIGMLWNRKEGENGVDKRSTGISEV